MIGKIILGKGFGGCISYCLGNKDKTLNKPERAEVLYFNQCYGNTHQLIRQFNEVRQLNKRIEKPVWHTTLSFTDELTKQNKIDIANKFAAEFGFSYNQYLVIEHNDTPTHAHLHIVANRVGFDGKTVSDSNNYKRMAEFCRKIEQEYQLTAVLSPEKFLPPQERNKKRNDSRKDAFKVIINRALLESSSIPQFVQQLNEFGYQVEMGRGIAFTDDKKVRVKGSEIGISVDFVKKQLVQNMEKQILISRSKDKTINLNL
jgi:hypothetical protein